MCAINLFQVYPVVASAAAAAGCHIGATVSAVTACTAAEWWLYHSHCLMPSVHSGTELEKQRMRD